MRHLLILATCAAALGCKKPAEPAAPLVGWHGDEGWAGQCYYPVDFASLGLADRRMARNEALDELMKQWRGERGDGMSAEAVVIENVETVLLGQPEKIEGVVAGNLDQCRRMMSGKQSSGDWERWLIQLPGELMAGECRKPLDMTMFDYLDIGRGWQFNAAVCDEDRIRITASSQDLYRVQDKGPWINAEGDRDQMATSEYPCSIEGCYVGQLILKFEGESGAEVILPLGTELIFDPPEHGSISIRVNDTDFFDNEFKVERGIQYRTSITYAPADE
ncbi:MAG: hypothetical protein ACON5B_05530 [Myxococcota bacterium]